MRWDRWYYLGWVSVQWFALALQVHLFFVWKVVITSVYCQPESSRAAYICAHPRLHPAAMNYAHEHTEIHGLTTVGHKLECTFCSRACLHFPLLVQWEGRCCRSMLQDFGPSQCSEQEDLQGGRRAYASQRNHRLQVWLHVCLWTASQCKRQQAFQGRATQGWMFVCGGGIVCLQKAFSNMLELCAKAPACYYTSCQIQLIKPD